MTRFNYAARYDLTKNERSKVHRLVVQRLRPSGSKAARILISLLDSYFQPVIDRKYHYRSKGEIEAIQNANEYRKLYEKEARIISNLKRQRLLSIREGADGVILRLTRDGMILALEQTVVACKKLLPPEERCFVIFDVPEEARAARQVFRRLLKRAGFTMIQKSVWVSRKDVMDYLCALIQASGLSSWVIVIKGVVCLAAGKS